MSRRVAIIEWPATTLLVTLYATGIAGCGRDSSGVPVQGAVSYNGRPIAQGALLFFPPRGRAIATSTNAAGKYTVTLPPGQYDVTVNVSVQLPDGWKEGDPIPPQEIVLPTQYTTRIKTPLQATVAASGEQSIDFALP
jgi:hypothetical protein